MKKSEIYHLAQIAVLCAATIAHENKLKILRVLLDDEQLAIFSEERAAKKEVENDAETV